MDDGERFLHDLLEGRGSVMVSTHDVEGRYLAVSEQARELTGHAPADLVGRSSYDLHHPDDLDAVQTGHVTLVATTQVIVVDYRLRHQDGSYVPVRSIAWSERDPATTTPTHLVVLTAARSCLTDEDVARLRQVTADGAQHVAQQVLS